MRRRDLSSCFLAGAVALIALLSVACAYTLPDYVDFFSAPDARLLFEACERPTDTDSTFSLAGASSEEGGGLALGAVVDLRPHGDTLYVAEVKHREKTLEQEVDDFGCLLFGWYGNYECLDDPKEYVETRESVPVIIRPPIDSVLLADMQTFLDERRIGTDSAAHEQGRLQVDISLIETQVTHQPGIFKTKIEGKVRIDTRVSDVATGETLWEHSFIGVGPVSSGSHYTKGGERLRGEKRHYRRALDIAYCSALDMIKNALDSLAIAPSSGTTDDSADSLTLGQ